MRMFTVYRFYQEIPTAVQLSWQQCYGCSELHKSKNWNTKPNFWNTNLVCNKTNASYKLPTAPATLIKKKHVQKV